MSNFDSPQYSSSWSTPGFGADNFLDDKEDGLNSMLASVSEEETLKLMQLTNQLMQSKNPSIPPSLVAIPANTLSYLDNALASESSDNPILNALNSNSAPGSVTTSPLKQQDSLLEAGISQATLDRSGRVKEYLSEKYNHIFQLLECGDTYNPLEVVRSRQQKRTQSRKIKRLHTEDSANANDGTEIMTNMAAALSNVSPDTNSNATAFPLKRKKRVNEWDVENSEMLEFQSERKKAEIMRKQLKIDSNTLISKRPIHSRSTSRTSTIESAKSSSTHTSTISESPERPSTTSLAAQKNSEMGNLADQEKNPVSANIENSEKTKQKRRTSTSLKQIFKIRRSKSKEKETPLETPTIRESDDDLPERNEEQSHNGSIKELSDTGETSTDESTHFTPPLKRTINDPSSTVPIITNTLPSPLKKINTSPFAFNASSDNKSGSPKSPNRRFSLMDQAKAKAESDDDSTNAATKRRSLTLTFARDDKSKRKSSGNHVTSPIIDIDTSGLATSQSVDQSNNSPAASPHPSSLKSTLSSPTRQLSPNSNDSDVDRAVKNGTRSKRSSVSVTWEDMQGMKLYSLEERMKLRHEVRKMKIVPRSKQDMVDQLNTTLTNRITSIEQFLKLLDQSIPEKLSMSSAVISKSSTAHSKETMVTLITQWEEGLMRLEEILGNIETKTLSTDKRLDSVMDEINEVHWKVNGGYMQTLKKLEDQLQEQNIIKNRNPTLEFLFNLLSYFFTIFSAIFFLISLFIRLCRSVHNLFRHRTSTPSSMRQRLAWDDILSVSRFPYLTNDNVNKATSSNKSPIPTASNSPVGTVSFKAGSSSASDSIMSSAADSAISNSSYSTAMFSAFQNEKSLSNSTDFNLNNRKSSNADRKKSIRKTNSSGDSDVPTNSSKFNMDLRYSPGEMIEIKENVE
ncbi:hypothetical protein BKA69DRAFT_1127948 [Paraphysoderma sedebokerense]|nr:hypothetical protein BKA69DRAFT_1127937 [Paraphysoderma sedebokerense]KAI9137766.1 hypothetical protein BKA69DRAFT_1127948 [Paraphysoderma sedebokerense]